VSLTPDDRAARRDEQRRAVRRRRLLVGAGIVAVGATVGVVVAIAAGGSGGSGGTGDDGAAAGSTQTHEATTRTAEKKKVILKLPPITKLKPGTAQVYTRGPVKGRRIALTFDDGFCPPCVASLVTFLEKTGTHATFFPNGRYEDSWKPVAKRIRTLVAKGQLVVGNHTFSHGDAKTQSPETFSADLQRNEDWIEKTFHITGRPWFRPPYGSYNQSTLDAAGKLGYTKVILWSGTLADSSPQTVPYLINAMKVWAKPGVIILAHGNYPNTPKTLPRMMRTLHHRHLTPVTIAELLDHAPPTPNQ
jgi:peptidoglycan-N-acetylglucosamine deacetylase